VACSLSLRVVLGAKITASLIARDRFYGHATITDRARIVAYKL